MDQKEISSGLRQTEIEYLHLFMHLFIAALGQTKIASGLRRTEIEYMHLFIAGRLRAAQASTADWFAGCVHGDRVHASVHCRTLVRSTSIENLDATLSRPPGELGVRQMSAFL